MNIYFYVMVKNLALLLYKPLINILFWKWFMQETVTGPEFIRSLVLDHFLQQLGVVCQQ